MWRSPAKFWSGNHRLRTVNHTSQKVASGRIQSVQFERISIPLKSRSADRAAILWKVYEEKTFADDILPSCVALRC